jgi:hypothetical protein
MDFRKRRGQVGHVPQAIPGCHQLETGVMEWQRHHVAGDNGDVVKATSSRSRKLQHAVRDVEANRRTGAFAGRKEQISCATRDVEDAVRRTRRGQIDEALFPAPILAIREKSGDEVVAVGDGRKQPAHVPAFAFAGGDGRAKRQWTLMVPRIISRWGAHSY